MSNCPRPNGSHTAPTIALPSSSWLPASQSGQLEAVVFTDAAYIETT
jgi:hypothetical protein